MSFLGGFSEHLSRIARITMAQASTLVPSGRFIVFSDQIVLSIDRGHSYQSYQK